MRKYLQLLIACVLLLQPIRVNAQADKTNILKQAFRVNSVLTSMQIDTDIHLRLKSDTQSADLGKIESQLRLNVKPNLEFGFNTKVLTLFAQESPNVELYFKDDYGLLLTDDKIHLQRFPEEFLEYVDETVNLLASPLREEERELMLEASSLGEKYLDFTESDTHYIFTSKSDIDPKTFWKDLNAEFNMEEIRNSLIWTIEETFGVEMDYETYSSYEYLFSEDFVYAFFQFNPTLKLQYDKKTYRLTNADFVFTIDTAEYPEILLSEEWSNLPMGRYEVAMNIVITGIGEAQKTNVPEVSIQFPE